MDAVFIKLLNMSISASWLILAVVVLRLILKNAPKWIRCILWGLVAVRLICPVSIESIFSLVPSAETVPQDIVYVSEPAVHTGVTAVNSIVNPYLSESMAPEVGASVNPLQIVVSLSAVIWFVGMIGMLLYAGISYLRIRRKVAASILDVENIYLCDYIETPFVLGIVKPRIYLPSAMAEDENAGYVIAHERAHIKRRDHWWKPLGFLLLTVYWFNPVIWASYVLLCRDIELACDESVIGSLGERDKKSYSNALLACSIQMKTGSIRRRMIAACPLAFGEVGVKKRVKAVLNYRKPAFWVFVVAVVACIVVAVCFLTDPAEEKLYAPEPFGHSYRVEEIVYDAPQFSFAYSLETAPRYQFTSDYAMFVSGDSLGDSGDYEWIQQSGAFQEVKLSASNFDDYFKIWTDGLTAILGPEEIRKNAKSAWRKDVEDDANGVFYYLILTKMGDVYLTYGYDVDGESSATDAGDLIRWIFKLARTDILSCNAVSAGCNAYVEPAYYPEGFDWEYDELPEGTINGNGVLYFTADWDTDTLIVSEDYYNNYDPDNRSGSTFIEKETYTLEREKSGLFGLNVKTRSANGDMAVYFIQGPTGVYVMRVLFYEDESALTVPLQEYAPEEILGMSWLDFEKLAGVSAELYHANFYFATIPGTQLTAVFLAEGWDDKNATAFLEEDDTVIRLEGTLGEMLPDFKEKMSMEEFVKDDMWSGKLVDYCLEEGAGTAYYVADRYVAVRYDVNGDNLADMMLQIALDEADRVSPDSYCWLSYPSDSEKIGSIVIQSGLTGQRITVEDDGSIQRIVEDIESLRYEKKGSSEGYVGYAYWIRFYNENGEELGEFNITEENGHQISYDGDFYLVGADLNIDVDYLDELLESASNVETGTPDWGLTLSVKNVTPSGMTLICTWSGGELAGELETGSRYTLQALENGNWVEVPFLAEANWTMEAYVIQKDKDAEFEINWEWLYGKLPAGTYRICKEFMDFRGAGDYDEALFYAEFEIK